MKSVQQDSGNVKIEYQKRKQTIDIYLWVCPGCEKTTLEGRADPNELDDYDRLCQNCQDREYEADLAEFKRQFERANQELIGGQIIAIKPYIDDDWFAPADANPETTEVEAIVIRLVTGEVYRFEAHYEMPFLVKKPGEGER